MNGMLKLLEGSHATKNWIEWGQKQSQKALLSLESTPLNSLPSAVFAVTYIKSSLHSFRAGCSEFARLQDADSATASHIHPSCTENPAQGVPVSLLIPTKCCLLELDHGLLGLPCQYFHLDIHLILFSITVSAAQSRGVNVITVVMYSLILAIFCLLSMPDKVNRVSLGKQG